MGVGTMLRVAAATCAVSLGLAAPAMADDVWISGTDSQACYISSLDGVHDASSGCGIGILGPTPSGFDFRGLLWFDIAANLPSGATVTSADLRIYHDDQPTACNLGMVVRRQWDNWLTTTPTWESPDGGTTQWLGGEWSWSGYPASYIDCVHDDAIFNVTTDVNSWVYDGGNNGFEITADEPFWFGPGLSEKPTLHIEYEL